MLVSVDVVKQLQERQQLHELPAERKIRKGWWKLDPKNG